MIFQTPDEKVRFIDTLLYLLEQSFRVQSKPNEFTAIDVAKFREIWHALLTQPKLPLGMQEILEYYDQLSIKSRNKIKMSSFLQFIKSCRNPLFNEYVKFYADPSFLKESAQQDDVLAFFQKQTYLYFHISDEASYQQYKITLINRLNKTPMPKDGHIDERQVLTERPYASLLKRFDTIAAWVCPSELSACAAVSCFSSGWVIASNMTNERDEQLIRASITSRFNTLKDWCNAALKEAPKDFSQESRGNRIQWIIQTIVTDAAYKAGVGAAGFSFEIPPEYRMDTGKPLSHYGREILAKVVDSVCFDMVDLTLLEKSYFLKREIVVLLPTNSDIKGLLSLPKWHKFKKMGNISSKNYHAEQLLFLYGDRDIMRLRGYLHMVGISKLCCADCFSIARQQEYLVSGSHEGVYPGVVNLYDLSMRGRPQEIMGSRETATPCETCGYITPSEEATQLRADVRQKKLLAAYQRLSLFSRPKSASSGSTLDLSNQDLSLSTSITSMPSPPARKLSPMPAEAE